MKTIYKILFIIGLGSAVVSAKAQQTARDTVLHRQVTVQRDYNPTIQDASKINTTPAIYEPVVSAKNLNFQYNAPRLSITNMKIGDSKSGDIMSEVLYDKRRGYFNFGFGTYSNMDAAAGYRIINTEQDEFNLFGTYNSTDGKIDYLKKQFDRKKEKAKDAEFKIGFDYKHKFEPSTLTIRSSYLNDSYNYYGNPFIDPASVSTLFVPDMNKKQNLSAFDIAAGLKSNDGAYLRYDGTVGYTYFKNKYGPHIDDDGLKGGAFHLSGDVNADLEADKLIGVKFYLMNQSISSVKYATSAFTGEAEHSLTNVYATPYIGFDGDTWDATLGVKVGSVFDENNSFIVAPDLYASVKLNDWNSLYASVTGGVNENTVMQIFRENKYVNPINRVGYSKTLFDLNAGFKLGSFEGLEFEIFGGYKQVKKDHLYVTNDFLTNNTSGVLYSWGNLSNAVYADVSTASFGGVVKTSLIPYTSVWGRLTGYSYSVKYKGGNLSSAEALEPGEKKAWGRPTFTAELNADVVDAIIPNLTLSMNYLLAGGRKAYWMGDAVSMKAINELNLRAEYRVLDWVSVNAHINNVLNQKYEYIYGYTLQGINVMGGVKLKF